MIAHYKAINNFDADHGMDFTITEPGKVHYSMTVLEKHLSSPMTCHGGVIAGFMDSIIGASALSRAFVDGNLVSTVEFKINYFYPVKLHDVLTGEGTIEFIGKSTIVSTGKILNQKGETVAIATGTFNIYPLKKRTELIPDDLKEF